LLSKSVVEAKRYYSGCRKERISWLPSVTFKIRCRKQKAALMSEAATCEYFGTVVPPHLPGNILLPDLAPSLIIKN
jgi:hypothetical protein